MYYFCHNLNRFSYTLELIKTMKKIILFVGVMFVIGGIQAQNLQILHGEEDVTSGNVTVEVSADTDPAVLHLDVKNTSANAIDVKVRKIENTLVEGASISLCWGINCYSPTQFETPTAATIEAGVSDDSFHGDYFHFGNTGTTTVTYVFFDDANPDDSSYVEVEYTLASVGIDDVEMANFSQPYPNPANDEVNFYYSVNSATTLNIYNTIGELIEKVDLSNVAEHIQISTNKYAAGTYIYEFKQKGIILDNGKFIVAK